MRKKAAIYPELPCSSTYYFAKEIKYDQYGHFSFDSLDQKKKDFEISMTAEYYNPRISDLKMRDKIREARTPLWMRKILSIRSFLFLLTYFLECQGH